MTTEKMGGLCQCGCGGVTNIASKSNTKNGNVKGQHYAFIFGHQNRGRKAERSGPWKGGRRNEGKYWSLYLPEHPHNNNGYVLEHRVIAEKIIGGYLPAGSVVHHIDGNGKNNAPSNLVVCENEGVHKLLHKRQRAYEECGNAEYLRCPFCKQYDDPKNMHVNSKQARHTECSTRYSRERRLRNGITTA